MCEWNWKWQLHNFLCLHFLPKLQKLNLFIYFEHFCYEKYVNFVSFEWDFIEINLIQISSATQSDFYFFNNF